MADSHTPEEPLEERSLRGFWVLVIVAALGVGGAAFPALRELILAVIRAPFAGLGALLPGATPQEDVQALGRFLQWVGLGLSPLLVVPLLAGILAALGMPIPRALSPFFNRLAGVMDRIIAIIGEAAKWLALALVLVVVTVVVQRYVFGIAFAKLQEAILYIHAMLFLLAIAYTLQRGGHVRVDVFLNRLSARGRGLVDLISMGVFGVLCTLLIILTARGYVSLSWRVLEGSTETSGLPLVYLLKTFIPLFAILLLMQCTSSVLRTAAGLIARSNEAA